MKKIAIITRDCAGVNAALRAVVRTANKHHIQTFGVIKGYDGLIDSKFITLNRSSVSGIVNLGGTILKTSRSKRFFTNDGQKKAIKNLHKNKIDGVIVIGGDGSLKGAHRLAKRTKIPVIGIPATIDNDITGVDLTIGSDTAVNVVLDALDKIRDTATSLERIFLIEVMGRESGYIAMQVALAGGCEEVLLPERKSDIKTMCEEIKQGNAKGKSSWIIIVAEGRAKAHDIARDVTFITGLETRVAVLGHIQRGGHPTGVDRILATKLGHYAVEILRTGKTDVCVSIKNNKIVTIPLSRATQRKTIDVTETYKLIKLLTK
ncbi:hypothetical protein AYK25_05070 [Thermoplasmatales archaeon SM1-50]|nr:MAG: hypothetical protein AYK25_05070 [Thermoplasmatales archaeon SM1-50]